MRIKISVAFAQAFCLAAAPLLLAQAPANAPAPQQQSRPIDAQRPPAKAPQPSESNPFPEDTNAIPVLPNTTDPAEAPAWDGTNPGTTSLPGEDNDPVRSPDDPVADSSSNSSDSSSSSLTGLDRAIAPPPDHDKRGKNAKQAPARPNEITQGVALKNVNEGVARLLQGPPQHAARTNGAGSVDRLEA